MSMVPFAWPASGPSPRGTRFDTSSAASGVRSIGTCRHEAGTTCRSRYSVGVRRSIHVMCSGSGVRWSSRQSGAAARYTVAWRSVAASRTRPLIAQVTVVAGGCVLMRSKVGRRRGRGTVFPEAHAARSGCQLAPRSFNPSGFSTSGSQMVTWRGVLGACAIQMFARRHARRTPRDSVTGRHVPPRASAGLDVRTTLPRAPAVRVTSQSWSADAPMSQVAPSMAP